MAGVRRREGNREIPAPGLEAAGVRSGVRDQVFQTAAGGGAALHSGLPADVRAFEWRRDDRVLPVEAGRKYPEGQVGNDSGV